MTRLRTPPRSKKSQPKSTSEVKREILCVSQFTLCHTLKGNKPDFRLAMGTEESKATYEQFLSQLRSSYEPQLVKGKRVGRKPVWMKKKIYKQLFSIFFRWFWSSVSSFCFRKKPFSSVKGKYLNLLSKKEQLSIERERERVLRHRPPVQDAKYFYSVQDGMVMQCDQI